MNLRSCVLLEKHEMLLARVSFLSFALYGRSALPRLEKLFNVKDPKVKVVMGREAWPKTSV